MIIVNIDSTCVRCGGIWQYDYGQILRIQNLKLPPAVEIHFSLSERGGQAVTRVGTTRDNVTDVVIPDSMLENADTAADYKIYAFIYLADQEIGQTEYKISMSVRSRPRPEQFEKQEDGELFRKAISEVNKSADSALQSKKRRRHGHMDMPNTLIMMRIMQNIMQNKQKTKQKRFRARSRKEKKRLIATSKKIEIILKVRLEM